MDTKNSISGRVLSKNLQQKFPKVQQRYNDQKQDYRTNHAWVH